MPGSSASRIRRGGEAYTETTHRLWQLLISAELLNKAQRESDKDKVRRHPRPARASVRRAVAVEALFDSYGWGGPDEEPRVSAVREAIEAEDDQAEGPSPTAGAGEPVTLGYCIGNSV